MKRCHRVSLFSCLIIVMLGLAAAAGMPVLAAVQPNMADSEVKASLASLQIPFVENEGQIGDEQVKYYAKTFAGTVFVTDDGIVYNLPKGEEGGWVLQEEFAGGNALEPATASAPGAPVNYYIGNVEKHVSSYQEITLGEVYDKIKVNLKAYGDNVEKIFTVAPGGDPAAIVLKVAGADGLSINAQGELELATGLGTVKMTSPVAYQIIDGQRVDVAVAYVINGGSYGFKIGEYDRNYPLVIDPLLASTFLGGSGTETGYSIALDKNGYVYVAGRSSSADFPGVDSGFDNSCDTTNSDLFVSKLSSDLTRVLSATYIGGGYSDSIAYGQSLALDSSGNVYLAAYTSSSDFPILGGYDSTFNDTNSKSDVVIIKLSGDLSQLLASTFLGGDNIDRGNGLVLDSSGNVYVAGYTQSTNFPASGGYQQYLGVTGTEGFVSKLSGDLGQLLVSTYIGGEGADEIQSIDLDSAGNVFIGGKTLKDDTSYPVTSGAYDTIDNSSSSGGTDAVISKLSSDLSQLLASTYLGSDNGDSVNAITVDSAGNLYATLNAGAGFPVTSGTLQQDRKGLRSEIAIVKMNSDLTQLLASTFLGGTGADNSNYIAVDSAGNIIVAGTSGGTDYPITPGAYQEAKNGTGGDIIVTKIKNDLTGDSLGKPLASTYFGGVGSDTLGDMALDANGNVYLTGAPNASGYDSFPIISGSFQTAKSGTSDAFISKLTGDLALTGTVDATAPVWGDGGSLTVSNETDSGLTLTWAPAMDNVGVTDYKIFQDTLEVATVSSAVCTAANGMLSYDLTGLVGNTTYTFGVEAVDANNNQSTGGPTVSGTTLAGTDLTPPYWTDGSLEYSNLTDTGVTLTWSGAADIVGVTGYQITDNGSVVDAIYGASTCNLTNLTAGTPYTFQVQAFDAAGNISTDGPSIEVTSATPADTLAPYWTAMSTNNLTINAISPTQVYYEWPAATDNVGVTGYEIIRGTGQTSDDVGVGNPSVIATVYDTTHYTITFPDTTTAYDFTLRAFDAAGNWSVYYDSVHIQPGESYGVYLAGAYLTAITGNPLASSTGASIEDSTSVPLKPMFKMAFSNNVVNNQGDDPVWPGNQQCFTLQTVAGSVYAPVNVTMIPDTISFTERNNIFVMPVNELAPNTQYKLIINPNLTPKNKKRSMSFERVVYFTTEATASGSPAWPSGGTLTASNPTASGMTLSWTPADNGAGVTSYVVIKNNSDIIQAVDGTTASCDVTGLASGTDYTFQVQSFDSATSWSSPGPSLTTETAAADPERVSAPVATPASGALTLGTTVALATTTDGATIYYTLDGSTPTASSLEYSTTPITINEPLTIKAIAVKTGMTDSSVMEAVYTIQGSAGSSESGVYTLVLTADPAYTIGRTAAGIDAFTVESGITGNHTFTITISPVAAHEGSEKAVFVQLRSGIPLKIKAVEEDFDTVNTAETSFNVEPGDVVKVLIVDDLYAAFDRIATVLAQ